MKTITRIKEITHDDLVTLLGNAFYGSEFLGLEYNSIEYHNLPNTDDDDCIEDCCAKLLLAGKSIVIYDMYAEDEEDFHGKLPHHWDREHETMDYTVTMKDIWKGLGRCLNGTFKVNDGCDNEVSYIGKCMANLIAGDGELDQPQAETILQVIVFGQWIYD